MPLLPIYHEAAPTSFRLGSSIVIYHASKSSYLHVVSFVLGDAFAMQAMDLAIDIASVKPMPVVQSLCMTFPHRTRQY